MTNGNHSAPAPFYYRHLWKNLLLLALSGITAPISILAVLVSLAVSKLHRDRHRTFSTADRSHGATVELRKSILVTGISMTKGLAIARNLSQHTPHRIIGADISAVAPGRFSGAINKYRRLDSPNGDDADPYIDSILAVIREEKIDLWISCSSVIAAVEDGQVVRLAEKQAREQGRMFAAVQFREDIVEKFHEKDQFIEYITSLGLLTPESYRCTTQNEVLDILMGELHRKNSKGASQRPTIVPKEQRRSFIMKPIGVDDKARNDMMTLLPLSTVESTTKYIRQLKISRRNPFQLQQYIKGKEYTTHALVIRGKVKAFCSCPSLELLMHYEPLSMESVLNQAMLNFTERVCEDCGETFSGHLSFDFFVETEDSPTKTDVTLYPIESNPRAHTAVVLLEQTPEMADAYLSILKNTPANTSQYTPPIFPRTPTYSYYWIGHDLVTLLVLPLLDLLFSTGSRSQLVSGVHAFLEHLVYWKDGTFALEDPLPFFVLYHVYWPSRFLLSLWRGKVWSRINVSTTKVFDG